MVNVGITTWCAGPGLVDYTVKTCLFMPRLWGDGDGAIISRFLVYQIKESLQNVL
jgi:hypothetical protein